MEFSDFSLDERLLRGVADMGFVEPTPIQEDAIPPALEGRDVLGAAMTGSGKTAAYMLPTLNRLLGRPRGTTRALVLAPTRELAQQVEQHMTAFAAYTDLTSVVIHGGVAYEPQEKGLRRGVDVVIATPGRLLDHLRRPYARLDEVEVLILDEADRMLDMGFIPDVRKILREVPEKRQTLLFSATMPGPIVALSREVLTDPATINIERKAMPATGITQAAYPVRHERKFALFHHLLEHGDIESALAFVRTKERADLLANYLEKRGISVAAIHGDRSQAQRTRALAAFKKGDYQALVATDVAARGLDLVDLTHVVNIDVPAQPEDYIHRVGRTARYEATGDAFTFVAARELADLHLIEKVIGSKIPRLYADGFDYRPGAERTEKPAAGPAEVAGEEAADAVADAAAEDRAAEEVTDEAAAEAAEDGAAADAGEGDAGDGEAETSATETSGTETTASAAPAPAAAGSDEAAKGEDESGAEAEDGEDRSAAEAASGDAPSEDDSKPARPRRARRTRRRRTAAADDEPETEAAAEAPTEEAEPAAPAPKQAAPEDDGSEAAASEDDGSEAAEPEAAGAEVAPDHPEPEPEPQPPWVDSGYHPAGKPRPSPPPAAAKSTQERRPPRPPKRTGKPRAGSVRPWWEAPTRESEGEDEEAGGAVSAAEAVLAAGEGALEDDDFEYEQPPRDWFEHPAFEAPASGSGRRGRGPKRKGAKGRPARGPSAGEAAPAGKQRERGAAPDGRGRPDGARERDRRPGGAAKKPARKRRSGAGRRRDERRDSGERQPAGEKAAAGPQARFSDLRSRRPNGDRLTAGSPPWPPGFEARPRAAAADSEAGASLAADSEAGASSAADSGRRPRAADRERDRGHRPAATPPSGPEGVVARFSELRARRPSDRLVGPLPPAAGGPGTGGDEGDEASSRSRRGRGRSRRRRRGGGGGRGRS